MRSILLLSVLSIASAADFEAILSKWKPVQMPFNPAGLSERQRQSVQKLVDASRYLEEIYWQQGDPAGLKLYRSTSDPKLKRLLMINGGRFNLLEDNKPFAGSDPMPPGRNLYPKELTREKIEAYVKAHPEQKDAIYNPYTVLRWKGAKIEAIPYHVEYKQFLEAAAKSLTEAADLSDDQKFAKFLRLRARALLTDDYYESDLAWLGLAPYFETGG